MPDFTNIRTLAAGDRVVPLRKRQKRMQGAAHPAGTYTVLSVDSVQGRDDVLVVLAASASGKFITGRASVRRPKYLRAWMTWEIREVAEMNYEARVSGVLS